MVGSETVTKKEHAKDENRSSILDVAGDYGSPELVGLGLATRLLRGNVYTT